MRCNQYGCFRNNAEYRLGQKLFCRKHYEWAMSRQPTNRNELLDGRLYSHPDGNHGNDEPRPEPEAQETVMVSPDAFRPGTPEWKRAKIAADVADVLRAFDGRAVDAYGNHVHPIKPRKRGGDANNTTA